MVTDSRGDALALSDGGSPEFVVTFPKSLRAMLDVFPLHTLSPGDVLVTNDPWLLRRSCERRTPSDPGIPARSSGGV